MRKTMPTAEWLIVGGAALILLGIAAATLRGRGQVAGSVDATLSG
jgi:hypothetical protein